MEKLDIRPIKTATDHAWAMEQIDALKSVVAQRSHGNVRLQKGKYYTKEDTSAEYEQLKNRKFAGAIEFRIDQLGINRSQLATAINFPKSRVSEVLNGKRKSFDEFLKFMANLRDPE